MPGIAEQLRSFTNHSVSRNVSWLLIGQGANLLLQTGSFILLARLLGVKEYGIFAGAFALVNLLTPYSTLGAGMLFMRYVTADRSKASTYWGNSLVLTVTASCVIAAVLFLSGPVTTQVHDHWIFVWLALANCLCSQVTVLGSLVFQTFEKMRWTAGLSLISNLARFMTLLAMRCTLHHATAMQWSGGMLIASGSAAGFSMACVRLEIGPATLAPGLIWKRATEGLGFSFAGTTQAAYNDIDKVMLSHYGLSQENGFYTLAYRVIDVATIPIVALDSALLPRFFRLGGAAISRVIRLALNSAGASVLLGVGIAATVTLLAPLIPHLIGRDFSGVLMALRWLCWIPLLRGIHRATGSALTGAGWQNARTAAQLLVAVFNLLLNLQWIPSYGWLGAAWSSVASDSLLAILNCLLLLWVGKRASRPRANARLQGVLLNE